MTVALRAVSRAVAPTPDGPVLPADVGRDATLYGAAGGFFLLLSLASTSTWIDPVPALVATLGN